VTLKGTALAAALLAATTTDAAACHRYSVWYYPWRQSCGGRASNGEAKFRLLPSRSVSIRLDPSISVSIRPNRPAMPLPSLARADLDEPEADEPTRGRVLLRAALEAANAH
jgi:hypothetical protein